MCVYGFMKSTLFSWYWTQLNDDRSYINGFFFHAEQICLDSLDTMRQFCLAFKSPQFTFSFLFCLFNDVCKMLFKDKMWNNKFYTWSARIEMLHFIIQIGVKLLCHHYLLCMLMEKYQQNKTNLKISFSIFASIVFS